MSTGAWQFLGAVVALIGVVGVTFGGIFTARGTRRSSPYDALERRVVYLEEKSERDTARIENQATEIAGLERRMSGVIRDRDDLLAYINVLQAWIAAGAKPPAPVMPKHLADVIPRWIPVDGALPPDRVFPDDRPKETP